MAKRRTRRAVSVNPEYAIEQFYKILDFMVSNGYVKQYAIGGGWGMNLWGGPTIFTEDIDIFFEPVDDSIGGVVSYISDGLRAATGKEPQLEGNHWYVAGIQTDFMVAGRPVEKRAIETAVTVPIFGYDTRVVRVEYLIAIAEMVARDTDLFKAKHMLRLYPYDPNVLKEARRYAKA